MAAYNGVCNASIKQIDKSKQTYQHYHCCNNNFGVIKNTPDIQINHPQIWKYLCGYPKPPVPLISSTTVSFAYLQYKCTMPDHNLFLLKSPDIQGSYRIRYLCPYFRWNHILKNPISFVDIPVFTDAENDLPNSGKTCFFIVRRALIYHNRNSACLYLENKGISPQPSWVSKLDLCQTILLMDSSYPFSGWARNDDLTI